ncbi:unnamed protein product [Tuber aestivum]|uniref:Bud22 domain-containing protein n=1 Tax=Tuber aestivum TaxID=59557 RepID=A0A292Q1S4_9PEZI|nr:unnamed protein product [Tuber aestivum]
MPKRKNPFTDPPGKSPCLPHPSTVALPARAHAQATKSLTSALPAYHRRIFRVLKKARGFETVKLIRRIKSSRTSTGPTARLEGELEVLKKVKLDLLARAHLRRCVGRDGRCVRSGVFDWGEVWGAGEGKDGEGQGMGKVERDVCARLYGAKMVREAMGDVLGGVRRILGVDEEKEMARSDNDGEEEGKRKIEARLGRKEEGGEVKGKKNGKNEKEDGEPLSLSASAFDDGDDDSGWSSASSPSKSKPKPKQKSGTSTFLPTLLAGYISDSSTSTSSTTKSKHKKGPPEKKQRKNRMGQQARRALWTKKYGQNAAHLRQETQREEERKRKREKNKKKKEEEKEKGQAEGNLHPSWEAARKAREGNMAVVQEALKGGGGGRKVVFD